MFKGDKIYLRTIEPQDADQILAWENDEENWRVSNTLVPFSRHLIEEYVKSVQDIFAFRQLRLMVVDIETEQTVGAVDLFDFDPMHQHVGVGVLIDKQFRGKGFALEALKLLENYTKNVLGVRNLHCSILADNEGSVRLFESCGFERIGTRKNWFSDKGNWLDEYLYQKLLVK